MNPDDHALELLLVKVHQIARQDCDDSNRISLDLSYWNSVLQMDTGRQETRWEKLRLILDFFIDKAITNNLEATPAAEELISYRDQVYRNLARTMSLVGLRADNWKERIGQLEIANARGTSLEETRRLVLNSVPLFNLWDFVSFLYTLCVEDIADHWHAELHLLQFRTILQAMRSVPYLSPGLVNPSTVVMVVGSGYTSLPIAFATSCVGTRPDKREMARIRFDCMKQVVEAYSKQEGGFTLYQKARVHFSTWTPGNCAEWLAWLYVSHRVGKYFTLCYSLDAVGKVYKCCPHCHNLAQQLGSNDVMIYDLLEVSRLAKDDIMYEGNVKTRLLKTWEEFLENKEGSRVYPSRQGPS